VNAKDQLQQELREVRRRYDAFKRGKTAPLRRCREAGDVALEEVYWQVGGSLARTQPHLAHVIMLFPLAPQACSPKRSFSFGRFLRRHLPEGDGAARRFRRLLASSDRDELDHHLRGVLRLACADKTPVDWGVLGVDILWFLAESDNVRRRWAQDFYAPIARDDSGGTAASTPNA